METTVIPWAWYITRASAIIGFLLLYIAIFFGTVSCLPGIRKYFLRFRSLNFHCWISVQAFLFALIHGFSLLFDKSVPFSIKGILVPFASTYEPGLVALGTISLYLMLILILTSYARRYFSYHVWRTVHFLNIALYLFSIVHALQLGSDLKGGLLRIIFIVANGLLLALLLFNLLHKIWAGIKGKPVACEIENSPMSNENLRQSYPAGGEKRSDQNFRRRV